MKKFGLATTCVSLLLAMFQSTTSKAADETARWVSLFDGETLDGWEIKGGDATYEIRDEAIVGISRKGQPNSFLCAEQTFADFRLELEFKVDPNLNSGVQIRSAARQRGPREVVYGYQVEIDPSERAWSGGIYDESRRGWIFDLSDRPEARAAFKQNEWNHYKIEAIGDHIRTWINGVPAADLRDSQSLRGLIGLQVHGTNSDEPLEVAWRNIRIQDLGAHEWEPIFDGESLEGWTPLPGGEWSVEEGAIHGTSPSSERRHGILLSNETYDDFTARLQFRVHSGDSGFYFRAQRVDSPVSVKGFQVEIDTTYETGGLYETGGRAWVVQHAPDKPHSNARYRVGEWNDLTLSAHGRNVVVQINGRRTAQLENDPGSLSGHFGLQLHGGQDMDVEFREIELLQPQADRN